MEAQIGEQIVLTLHSGKRKERVTFEVLDLFGGEEFKKVLDHARKEGLGALAPNLALDTRHGLLRTISKEKIS